MIKSLQVIAFAAVGAVASFVSAQSITTLVKDGDFYVGAGVVTNVTKFAVNNNGSWIVEAPTDGPADSNVIVLRDGAIFLQENDPLVGVSPGNISSFDSHNLNNNGVYGSNLFLRNTGSTSTDSGVVRNNVMVVQESTISMAPQFTPNTPYIGWFESRLNDNGQYAVLASVDDPNIPTTVDRAIVVWDVDSNGMLLSESVVIKEGDAIPGMGQNLTDAAGTGPHNFAFNNAGQVMYSVDGDGATTSDTAVFINNTMIIREGDASIIAGRNWANIGSTTRFHLNNSGDYAIIGFLDNTDTSNDNILFKSGGVVVGREGASLPAIGAFSITNFGTGNVQIDNDGNVFWFGTWNDPDTAVNQGIFMNDQLLVQKGVTMIDGSLLTTISSVQDNFVISENGLHLIFKGQLTGNVDGAFMITIPEPGALSLVSIGLLGWLARRRRA